MKFINAFLFVVMLWANVSNAQNYLDIQHWTTSKGLEVYFTQLTELPMLDVRLAFRAGSAYDNQLLGIGSLTQQLIGQATKNYNDNEIAEQFDRVGAEFGADIDRDMSVLSLRTLVEADAIKPALSMFYEILHPVFLKKDFNRIQQVQFQKLLMANQSPQKQAEDEFYEKVYGTHPYAHAIDGTKASLSKITLADVQQHFKKLYTAKNAVLVLVGDINRAQAGHIAEEIDRALTDGSAAPKLPEPATNLRQTLQRDIEFPSTQSAIRIGRIGITQLNPDYFPLIIGNYILGGGSLISRLGEEVREKRGLSYSVYSYFEPMQVPGPFLLKLETKSEKSKEALTVSLAVLQKFIEEGPSKNELDAAKKYYLGSMPFKISNNKAIANYLLTISFYDLPMNYLEMFEQAVNNVTLDQVRQAFKRHFTPEAWVIVRTLATKKNS